ncbi:nitroreductase [Paracoccus sp. TK19116]|uniref:Putative NAD(P)H nitroreductase n=1 Tax=Paracoccus albicereus TaxID=2922394 RepID=A0ABT1MS90_9RHOB|nr:nitroreductase [Paracoccus albicereus]MCQ0971175.1 nitroreductase [Paracoccus albicereus]
MTDTQQQESTMDHRDEAALRFLETRRSHPPKMLREPGPDRDEILRLLTLAARVPDHGKLEPWRFVVLERAALDRMAPILHQAVLDAGQDQAAADKAASALASPVIVAVIHKPVESPKVPPWEQELSAGALCLGLVNAALASGWGAAWLTGYAALNADFGAAHLGLAKGERVAGLIHLGTRGATPPDRPRPDVAALTTWLE